VFCQVDENANEILADCVYQPLCDKVEYCLPIFNYCFLPICPSGSQDVSDAAYDCATGFGVCIQ
jgi:hypothetical protein